jgi:drug/metabolite transporter (DMT)-like permease
LLSRYQYFESILWMVGATALWALAFIVPVMVPNASAVDITIGRFLVYGVGSSMLLLKTGLPRFTRREWALALAFALFGNVLYYLVLVLGIQLAGAGLAVPIIGLLPVTVSLFGNVRGRDLPFRQLALPLTAVLAGILLVNVSRANTFGGGAAPSIPGVVCLILPVVMWTWYAIANAAFLKHRPDISGTEWASVIGLTSLLLTVFLLIGKCVSVALGKSELELTDRHEWLGFGTWCLVLGAGASWGAAALFNKASARLPVALTGQLIVFETVFGVGYVFLESGRPPRLIEIAGFTLAILGIWLSIRVLHPTRSV